MSAIIQQGNSRYIYLQTRGQWYVLDQFATPLGAGAIGIVFPGWNYYTNERVAIKMVKPEYSNIPQVRDRARAEAQMTFLHPNIVRMLGICEYKNSVGPIFVLSEFVSGLNLDVFCKSYLSQYDEVSRIIKIILFSISVLDALQYVHSAGVIHRDVKPSNIMVTFNGVPKLMDLGIAGFENSDEFSEKGFIGTSLYAAPELINGGVVDQRTDLYAMGVTMFEVMTGYNPYDRPSQSEILDAHLSDDLPVVSVIPRKLMEILLKATHRNKSRRFNTASDFAENLKQFLNSYVSNPINYSSGRLSGNENRW